jgi:outer membrane protein OmpA-like peptidoglycan-associated protein
MIKNTALTNETQIDKIQTNKIKHSILKQKIAQLNLVQIDFKVNDTQLSVANQQNLLAAAAHIEEILLLSTELNTQIHIVLIGTSDTQDSTTKNLELSIERAKQVKQFLVSKGIRSDKLFTTGIGEVSFESENKSTRKVMFNVIYTPFEKNRAVSK